MAPSILTKCHFPEFELYILWNIYVSRVFKLCFRLNTISQNLNCTFYEIFMFCKIVFNVDHYKCIQPWRNIIFQSYVFVIRYNGVVVSEFKLLSIVKYKINKFYKIFSNVDHHKEMPPILTQCPDKISVNTVYVTRHDTAVCDYKIREIRPYCAFARSVDYCKHVFVVPLRSSSMDEQT